jgi:hypothetical protein
MTASGSVKRGIKKRPAQTSGKEGAAPDSIGGGVAPAVFLNGIFGSGRLPCMSAVKKASAAATAMERGFT